MPPPTMAGRDFLPPPPPPPHLRAWPGREALLAGRTMAIRELSRRMLGGGRLTLFLLTPAGLQAGWAFIGGAIVSLDGPTDPLVAMAAALAACLGLAAMVALVIVVVLGVRRDRTLRARLLEWAAPNPSPVRDARFRAPGMSLAWLLSAFALCAAGLGPAFAVPAPARPGDTTYAEVAYAMGAGLWVHGLIGAAKAVAHRRLALRPAPPGASRSDRAGLVTPGHRTSRRCRRSPMLRSGSLLRLAMRPLGPGETPCTRRHSLIQPDPDERP